VLRLVRGGERISVAGKAKERELFLWHEQIF